MGIITFFFGVDFKFAINNNFLKGKKNASKLDVMSLYPREADLVMGTTNLHFKVSLAAENL